MKIIKYLFLFLPLILTVACKDDDGAPTPELTAKVLEVELENTVSKSTPLEVNVTIQKPTPCHQVKEVIKTVLDKVYKYDIILEAGDGVCAAVIAEEVVKVSFDPPASGEYVLQFSINGKQQFYQKIIVTD